MLELLNIRQNKMMIIFHHTKNLSLRLYERLGNR